MKPRLIIYNVSEEITIEKVITIIKGQNPEITLNGEVIVTKFTYKNRKGKYNIVVELRPHAETNSANQTENRVGNMQYRKLPSPYQVIQVSLI